MIPGCTGLERTVKNKTMNDIERNDMIVVNHLTKRFGSNTVLKDINIRIRQGEVYGLIGKSGVGKSTLLRCINGLETFDEGEVIVDGVDIKSLNPKELREFRKNVGMIFQQFSLLSRLSVAENIAMPMKMWKCSKEETEKRVDELLEMVGLTEKKKSYPNQLSGGQKQRVAIARALALRPKVLLCDEATSALDPNIAKSIIELLLEINRNTGVTIIVVTHQMSVLKSCCERITILENGEAAVTGDSKEIFMQQSAPLLRLIGSRELDLPEEGQNIKLILSDKNYNSPIITDMAKNINADVRIIGGELEKFRDSTLGTIIINISEEETPKILEYLQDNNVKWMPMDREKEAEEGGEEE